jgi:predicted nucleotidyltransferase
MHSKPVTRDEKLILRRSFLYLISNNIIGNMREEIINEIIKIFLKGLGKEMSINQISKVIGFSYEPTYRHIKYLEKKKVLIGRRAGKAIMCKINQDSLDARKLLEKASLEKTQSFMKEMSPSFKKLIDEVIRKVEEELNGNILSIVLFGSYAKGIAKKESDVDLLFLTSEWKESERKIQAIVHTLEYKYGFSISPLIMCVKDFENSIKEGSVANEIIDFGIVLYGFETYYRILFKNFMWLR